MIVNEAYRRLFPDKYEGRYEFDLKYSGKFKGYNANVKYLRNKFSFYLSKEWERVDDEIKIGIIQHLLCKALNVKKKTTNMDLYDLFLKNIHVAIPKDQVDDLLKESFDRVNDKYFYGMVTMPNLIWGNETVRKLGSYDYGTDTISISKVLADDSEALDYVMHHEMLHKKLKFYTKSNKSYSHTSEFKKKEKEFENHEEIEKRLGVIVSGKRSTKKRASWKEIFGGFR